MAHTLRRTLTGAAAIAAAAVAAYAGYVANTWLRFGRPAPARVSEQDDLLDRFIPRYDVAERHHIRIAAPADTVFAAARQVDLQSSLIIRGIFRARELVLGAERQMSPGLKGLIGWMTSIGWGILAEVPNREIVLGAVTQPWLADVSFRALPPDRFARFCEPGFVKIVWTLRADPVSGAESVFRTETRVATTDPASRSTFRWYWARFSPGIVLIRHLILRQLRREVGRAASGPRRQGP